jgi:DsbC/DsbD-like thiol-disulfide interchange protein
VPFFSAFLWAALLVFAPGVAHVQAPPKINAPAHASVEATVTVAIDAGYHIQSNHPKLDYLIPSEVSLTPADGIELKQTDWPKPEEHKFSFSADALDVFEGNVPVRLRIATGTPGTHTIQGSLHYQACTDQLCRPPATAPFTLTVVVSGR